MIQTDIVSLFVIVAFVICSIGAIVGEYRVEETKKYKELKRKYKKLERNYMKLMDVLEEVETEES